MQGAIGFAGDRAGHALTYRPEIKASGSMHQIICKARPAVSIQLLERSLPNGFTGERPAETLPVSVNGNE